VSDPSATAVKTLFALSRNVCFFESCEEQLTDPEWKQVAAEIAHIKGEKPTSARYDPQQPDDERQGFHNLLLLCPKHHKLIDRLTPDDFSVDRLIEMKNKHLDHLADTEWCSDEQAAAFAQLAIEYARGQTDPGLRVLYAQYGANESYQDVTSRVNANMSNNQVQIEVSNETMGGDPLENVVKELEVRYTVDGVEYQKTFPEGDTAQLP
jgi:hypothetical protein